eukprot:7371178-Pyramimonas_sp.AAC.1
MRSTWLYGRLWLIGGRGWRQIDTLEDLERTIAELEMRGELTADVPNMGPADINYAVDDDSTCKVHTPPL